MADEKSRARNRKYVQSERGREKRKELKRNWARRKWAREKQAQEEDRRLDELAERYVERYVERRWSLPPEDLRWLRGVAEALKGW